MSAKVTMKFEKKKFHLKRQHHTHNLGNFVSDFFKTYPKNFTVPNMILQNEKKKQNKFTEVPTNLEFIIA